MAASVLKEHGIREYCVASTGILPRHLPFIWLCRHFTVRFYPEDAPKI